MNSNHFRLNQKTLGNIIMVASLFSLSWMYLPILFYWVNPPVIPMQAPSEQKEDSISIPKIKAYAQLTFNIDPWNSSSYERALEHGVAHAKGTALPGESGTSYLFAHSSLPIWRMTHTNTPFLFLNQLTADDQIIIIRNNQKYIYRVISKIEVWPNEVSYLINKTDGVDLILQTCTPLGTALKRLLVFGIRVV